MVVVYIVYSNAGRAFTVTVLFSFLSAFQKEFIPDTSSIKALYILSKPEMFPEP